MAADSTSSPAPSADPTAWAALPPYRPPDEHFARAVRGACHCGRVEYWLRAPPLASKLCHCRGCQLLHGAPCQWAAVVDKADVAFARGTDGLSFYHAPARAAEHVLPCKVRCAHCGSPVLDEGRRMLLLFPPLLADRRGCSVGCHIFYPQRVVDIPDGRPKWDGLDGKSQLVGGQDETEKRDESLEQT